MTARRYWPGLILGLILLAACQPDAQSGSAADADSSEAKDSEDDSPAIPVETSAATRADIYAMYSGTAPIEADAEAGVIAKVAGEIREILVEEGDEVRSKQVLARLDGDRLRLELMQSEANLRKAQRDYQRNIDLKDRSLISTGDFEKLKYEMQALEAAYNLAKLELSYTDIRAPITGVISQRFVKIGNTINVNDVTFRVTSFEPLIVYLHIPEREYRRIERGQTAVIEVDALQGSEFEATVARISPVVDPATGTFKITVEVSDPTRRLKPGMFATLFIDANLGADALTIPEEALIATGERNLVFVRDSSGMLQPRDVVVGHRAAGRVVILSGLAEHDEIVASGNFLVDAESRLGGSGGMPGMQHGTAGNGSVTDTAGESGHD